MNNRTGITDISSFDTTISSDATQKLDVWTDTYKVGDEPGFTEKLIEYGVLNENTYYEHRNIRLIVDGAEPNEHSLCDYNAPIATASYSYYPEEQIGQVGSVVVLQPFRGYGIGTQMKKHINNHIEQDGATRAYTWVATTGGEHLARKTGYHPTTEIPVEEILVREIDS